MHLRKRVGRNRAGTALKASSPEDWLSQNLKELSKLPSEKSNQKFYPDVKTINHNNHYSGKNGPKGAIMAFTSWGQPTSSDWT